MRAKIVDHRSLEKDMNVGTVINTNHAAYLEALERANKAQKDKDRLDQLEQDVSDIKQLLVKILEKVE
jgi:hypothetical protein